MAILLVYYLRQRKPVTKIRLTICEKHQADDFSAPGAACSSQHVTKHGVVWQAAN